MYKNIVGVDELFKWKKELPSYVYISLTNSCNANCVFCDVHENKLKTNKLNIYKLIDEIADMGAKYIHFMGGGEPFTDPLIEDYIKYISQKGLYVACTTNGLLLSADRIQRLKDCNLSHMFISIDGAKKEIHDKLRRVDGIFENAVNAINRLKEMNKDIVIVINHVINKRNIDSIDEMIMLKETVKFDYLNLLLVKDCPELEVSDEQREKYLQNIDKYRMMAKKIGVKFFEEDINVFQSRCVGQDISCYFPYYATYVDCPTGKVYPCDCTIHRSEDYCYGNLFENSFTELWNGEKLKDLRSKLINEKMLCKTFCDSVNISTNIEWAQNKSLKS